MKRLLGLLLALTVMVGMSTVPSFARQTDTKAEKTEKKKGADKKDGKKGDAKKDGKKKDAKKADDTKK